MAYLYFAFLILGGFVAYRFRCWSRFWYGWLEIGAAIGLMIIAVFHPEPGKLLLENGSFFGCVPFECVVLRGLDIFDGTRARQHVE